MKQVPRDVVEDWLETVRDILWDITFMIDGAEEYEQEELRQLLEEIRSKLVDVEEKLKKML